MVVITEENRSNLQRLVLRRAHKTVWVLKGIHKHFAIDYAGNIVAIHPFKSVVVNMVRHQILSGELDCEAIAVVIDPKKRQDHRVGSRRKGGYYADR